MKSSLKQWIFAIVIIMAFFNAHHNSVLLTTIYGHYDEDYMLSKPNNVQVLDRLSKPRPVPTLALTDPHFLGGFRNQHMRFVSFINHAITRNISQILLPSIRWGDAYNKGRSIPHEYLFDVKYWNERAEEKGLPFLVLYDEDVLERNTSGMPCFNTSSGLYHGLYEEYLRSNETNLRHVDTLADIQKNGPRLGLMHCGGWEVENVTARTYLVPVGAGKQAGKFWNDYFELQKELPKSSIAERHPVEQAIFQLLRPSLVIRSAMEKAVAAATNRTRGADSNNYRFLALHPRVEQEMMTHRCSVFHEQNLTRVFERIEQFPAFSTPTNNESASARFNFDLIFVAVSAYQVEKPPRDDPKAMPLRDIMVENKQTLLHARQHGLFGNVPIFESGAVTAKQIRFRRNPPRRVNDEPTTFTAESLGAVELLASIINFFTCITADVFVGVRGSSFSTDVFAVRHYLKKDEAIVHGGNYILGREGIEELVGPPQVHTC